MFSRKDGVWTQQGEKLVGIGAVGDFVGQGWSVALSAMTAHATEAKPETKTKPKGTTHGRIRNLEIPQSQPRRNQKPRPSLS